MMAAHYLNTISEALYEFGDGSFSIEDCEIMALVGLRYSEVWDQLDNEQAIINAIDDLTNNGQKDCH